MAADPTLVIAVAQAALQLLSLLARHVKERTALEPNYAVHPKS